MAISTAERNAALKAIHLDGAAKVRRLQYGVYAVPSATEATVEYVVRGTGRLAHEHTCTCPAGQHGRPCWHVYAVQLRKTREDWLRFLRKQGVDPKAFYAPAAA